MLDRERSSLLLEILFRILSKYIGWQVRLEFNTDLRRASGLGGFKIACKVMKAFSYANPIEGH
jgi:hypothetical protein